MMRRASGSGWTSWAPHCRVAVRTAPAGGQPPARSCTTSSCWTARTSCGWTPISALLRDGPAAGIYFLCLDGYAAQLPPECRRAVVQLADDHGAAVAPVRRPGYDLTGVIADAVSAAVAQAAARALAPFREPGELPPRTGCRPRCRSCLPPGWNRPEAADPARWAAGGRSTARAARGPVRRPVRRSTWARARTCWSRHHRVRQERAAADAGRLAGGGEPARCDELRAHRLQGRRRLPGCAPAAAHRRHGHRPG